MSRHLFIISLLLFLIGDGAFAQTKVVKMNAVQANDYGIRYLLPKTVLMVTVDYTQTQKKAGSYAKYASRYLGIPDSEVAMEDETTFLLDKISVETQGIPNKAQSYRVAFRAKTTAPFVCLTEDGLICSINAEYQPAPKTTDPVPPALTANARPNPPSIYTEEYLHAGSAGKMAEVAAKNIYRIRESRQDLLTGEVDNVPKDGEAMKIILETLDAQETRWMELFTGTVDVRHFSKQITIEPVSEITKEVLFRFSRRLGLVDADDLSGIPVYWDLKDLKTVEASAPAPKKKAKDAQGIVYNVPGKVSIKIYTAQQPWTEAVLLITQFGVTDTLGTELFEGKKGPVQIYFYPETGAIRQIVQ
jgi:hypothetical protein